MVVGVVGCAVIGYAQRSELLADPGAALNFLAACRCGKLGRAVSAGYSSKWRNDYETITCTPNSGLGPANDNYGTHAQHQGCDANPADGLPRGSANLYYIPGKLPSDRRRDMHRGWHSRPG